MSVDQEGYLSNEINKIEEQLKGANHKYFDLAKRVNKFAHKSKYKLNIGRTNGQEITVASLFISTLESYNSVYILLSKSLLKDAKVILRSMLESTFIMKYVTLSEEKTMRYHTSYEKTRLKLMNVILNDTKETYSDLLKSSITEEERDELKKSIEENDYKDLPPIEQIADEVGLLSYYNNVYRLLNSDVHSSPVSLNRFIRTDENSEVTDLEWFSYFNHINPEIRLTLYTAITLVVLCLDLLYEFFELETDDLEPIVKETEDLGEEVREQEGI